jgi:tRNA pseudouridine38-40 synthase
LRYFFHIGYNGFNYRGWQRLPQTGEANVQVVIETQLSKILKTELSIVGCGRTDAQVHASQFFFHVDIEQPFNFDLAFRLNKNLPADIAIFDILPMEGFPHARFDAKERTYNYFIHTSKDPYLSNISALYLDKDLDIDEMRRAVLLLFKYDDYKALSKNVPADKSTICTVSKAKLYVSKSGDALRFEITANRFVNGMIRIVVHKLLQIGRKELSVDQFESYLVSKVAPSINKRAHPQGLYLSKIRYAFLDMPSRSELFNSLVSEVRWIDN